MGAAGDMIMSALYELISEKQDFLNTMNRLFPGIVQLIPEERMVNGIAGTHIKVLIHEEEETSSDAHEQHKHSHTTHSHGYSYKKICEDIASLPLSDFVKKHAALIYRKIGEAESMVHRCDLEQIHFHEVGSLDAIIDVVGSCLLIEMLAPDKIVVSPIHVGNGTVRCAHGILPVPAPATAEILKDAPYYTGNIPSELCTPTGAAILTHFANEYQEANLYHTTIGIGLGNKEFEQLNAVRVFLSDTIENADTILDLSCNIDDMTGEAFGYAMELLLNEGALDVYYESVQMKKHRPGIVLHCFCNPEDKERFIALILAHTTTRGVRYQTFCRAKLNARFEDYQNAYGSFRIKISEGYGVQKKKVEFEDIKKAAETHQVPLAAIYDSIHLQS